MRKTVYVETSIVSYLAARPSRDVLGAAWQQLSAQWWDHARPRYDLFISELVVVEASRGDAAVAARRLKYLARIPVLKADERMAALAERLIAESAMPPSAEADALHVALATVHGLDYLLTWNCRHIDNAEFRPLVRSVCLAAGYRCPEICTPLELLAEEVEDVR
ncbi:type II toxin-antitoxin system VapC family toxin [candidate division WOR-3 bacterium]|nr:type II toxin-antitoxin system VapC family toxin [candidate division WOR-3 bacterium]